MIRNRLPPPTTTRTQILLIKEKKSIFFFFLLMSNYQNETIPPPPKKKGPFERVMVPFAILMDQNKKIKKPSIPDILFIVLS